MKKLQDITDSEFDYLSINEEPKIEREEKWILLTRLLEEDRIIDEEVSGQF